MQCLICRKNLGLSERLSPCPSCNTLFHTSHLLETIKIFGSCPVCQTPLNQAKIQPLSRYENLSLQGKEHAQLNLGLSQKKSPQITPISHNSSNLVKRETIVFYIKNYPKYGNYGVFSQKQEYIHLLDEFVDFLSRTSSVISKRLSKSGFEFIRIPYQGRANLNHLEQMARHFERLKNIQPDLDTSCEVESFTLNTLFYVRRVHSHKRIILLIDRAQKIDFILAREMLNILQQFFLEKSLFADAPIPSVKIASMRIAERKPPLLILNYTEESTVSTVLKILELISLDDFTLKAQRVRDEKRRIRSKFVEREKSDYFNQHSWEYNRDEQTHCEYCGEKTDGENICGDCWEEEEKEQNYFLDSDYDLQQYGDWEGERGGGDEKEEEDVGVF